MAMAGFRNRREDCKEKNSRWLPAFSAMAICAGLISHSAPGQSAASNAVAPTPASVTQSAPKNGQQTYASAREASQALFAALQEDDLPSLLKILGPDANDILSSGDETEDREDRAQFVEKYKEMHRLLTEPDGFTTLYVGAENWPTPIPMAHMGNVWYFDTAAGEKEILYRRIGQNELTVLQVCWELVAAEKEYHAQPRDGDTEKQYAEKILSSQGKHNGLYWEVTQGESESPLGPFVAAAEQEGYSEDSSQKRQPFHGYYFRVLREQGPKAPGGAMSYVVDGKMTRGFAFLAYPAEYRSSGVMTFLVGQDGVVYQKDLGSRTEETSKSLKQYEPDSTWRKAE
jgi:hypothetical protein